MIILSKLKFYNPGKTCHTNFTVEKSWENPFYKGLRYKLAKHFGQAKENWNREEKTKIWNNFFKGEKWREE